MKTPRARGLLLLAFSAALLAAVPSGRAEHHESAAETKQDRAALGAVSYRIHCSSCHGDRGGCKGPMAEVLKLAPTDLTRLAEKNGGDFPSDRVYSAIDGRGEIPAHGTREMPVWGIGFQDPGRSTDQEMAVRAKIFDLIAYLETLQGGDEEAGSGD